MDQGDLDQEIYFFPLLFDDTNNPEDDRRRQSNLLPQQQPTAPINISEWKRLNCVTTLYQCEVADAKSLYILDISKKLQHSMEYDIGGVYNDGNAELWFSYTTTRCPGEKYLMNLFVCHRRPGIFALGISNSNGLIQETSCSENLMTMSNSMDWYNFKTTQSDVTHYIKTFLFSEDECCFLQDFSLVIPITIDVKPLSILNRHVVDRIKFQYDFGEELLKGKQKDFTVKSDSGKEYRVHKIVLAAHSPVIRDAIRADDCNTYCIDMSDNDVELLIQFLYTGNIQNIQHNYDLLLAMAYKFKLKNLVVLVKYAIKASINSTNALSLAVLAEKYDDKEIQDIAFQYIQLNPETLNSDDFSQIDNASLVKKLLKYIHLKTT